MTKQDRVKVHPSDLVNFSGSKRRKFQRLSGLAYVQFVGLMSQLDGEAMSEAYAVTSSGNVVDAIDALMWAMVVHYDEDPEESELPEMGMMDIMGLLQGDDPKDSMKSKQSRTKR